MVADCGGGTVDLTVHQLEQPHGTLKELYKASGEWPSRDLATRSAPAPHRLLAARYSLMPSCLSLHGRRTLWRGGRGLGL